MTPRMAWLLILQLVLGPTLVPGFYLKDAIKVFRHLYIDFPRVEYDEAFQGYCNGVMGYVRGIMNRWDCPKIHYLVHVPFKTIRKYCKQSQDFCKSYNQFCTMTTDSFPLTICELMNYQLPINCHYNSTLTNQKLFLLCSSRYNAEPIDIIGVV